jgi:hypothetical protein
VTAVPIASQTKLGKKLVFYKVHFSEDKGNAEIIP